MAEIQRMSRKLRSLIRRAHAEHPDDPEMTIEAITKRIDDLYKAQPNTGASVWAFNAGLPGHGKRH